ncbi:hypothetical protein [Jidongwangia harbinensis]|uniref:hypothetical protein n=1 Tax=Jidongwangia harbinensis TaxID=2878561 RepID=UPI001CD9A44C|nr:hypothetical protein [Jidongwangia harbinensis]MCA2211846.1 hypothetical protein [Jidongwangia harbinensis]
MASAYGVTARDLLRANRTLLKDLDYRIRANRQQRSNGKGAGGTRHANEFNLLRRAKREVTQTALRTVLEKRGEPGAKWRRAAVALGFRLAAQYLSRIVPGRMARPFTGNRSRKSGYDEGGVQEREQQWQNGPANGGGYAAGRQGPAGSGGWAEAQAAPGTNATFAAGRPAPGPGTGWRPGDLPPAAWIPAGALPQPEREGRVAVAVALLMKDNDYVQKLYGQEPGHMNRTRELLTVAEQRATESPTWASGYGEVQGHGQFAGTFAGYTPGQENYPTVTPESHSYVQAQGNGQFAATFAGYTPGQEYGPMATLDYDPAIHSAASGYYWAQQQPTVTQQQPNVQPAAVPDLSNPFRSTVQPHQFVPGQQAGYGQDQQFVPSQQQVYEFVPVQQQGYAPPGPAGGGQWQPYGPSVASAQFGNQQPSSQQPSSQQPSSQQPSSQQPSSQQPSSQQAYHQNRFAHSAGTPVSPYRPPSVSPPSTPAPGAAAQVGQRKATPRGVR